jgi:hypothetical protein
MKKEFTLRSTVEISTEDLYRLAHAMFKARGDSVMPGAEWCRLLKDDVEFWLDCARAALRELNLIMQGRGA